MAAVVVVFVVVAAVVFAVAVAVVFAAVAPGFRVAPLAAVSIADSRVVASIGDSWGVVSTGDSFGRALGTRAWPSALDWGIGDILTTGMATDIIRTATILIILL